MQQAPENSTDINRNREDANQMKRIMNTITAAGKAVGSGALLLAMLAGPTLRAQTVTLFGALGNFDVLNDTGQDTHGFEIEVDGVTPSQIIYTFDSTRY